MNLINVSQMAEKLCSTTATVYSWVYTKKIPSNCVVKVGKKLLFDNKAVNQWLEQCRQKDSDIMHGI